MVCASVASTLSVIPYFQADEELPSIDWSGTGRLTLQNACTIGSCEDHTHY
jgi:hypothetical protein